MTRRGRAVALAVLSVLALGVLAGCAAGQSPGERTPDRTLATNASAEQTLILTKNLRLTPDRPGEITVEARYDTPSNLVELRAKLPSDATVTSTRGFSRGDGEYVWDGQVRQPTITYRVPVNETREATGPLAGAGEYLFVDPGPWALIRIPQMGTSGKSTGSGVTLSKRTTVAGEGAVGETMAFLGPHEERQRTANGQTFRLIVPAAADLQASPADVFDSVSAASERLRVGNRDDRVLMIAAPTDGVGWGVLGLQTGPADFWVRDAERLATADNVWLHEYVHTRQDYRTTAGTKWFTEASATYYAALFTLQQGRIGFDKFAARLERGSQAPGADAVLSNPDTWAAATPYRKGALVTGKLDRRMRVTDAGTFQAVFREMNARESQVTAAEFRDIVGRVSGDDVVATADRYTGTTAAPSMWSQDGHEQAFQVAFPRFSYAFPDPRNASAHTVNGPLRNGSISGAPITLATGETLAIDATVSNTGGVAGTYDARLLVNRIQVGRYTGRVDTDSATTLRVSHTFTAPGQYTLSLGNARRTVVVREPATLTVSALRTSPTEPIAGDTVAVTATVRNGAAVPAVGSLTLVQNGTSVTIRNVTLGPGERQDVRFERTLDSSGTYEFRVDNQTASVTVRREGIDDRTTGTGPGFGVPGALAVLLLLIPVAAIARRRRP